MNNAQLPQRVITLFFDRDSGNNSRRRTGGKHEGRREGDEPTARETRDLRWLGHPIAWNSMT